MPLRPGVQIQTLTAPPPRSAPTDTGVWFPVGFADQGRTDAPIYVTSMSDVVRLLGARSATNATLYDSLELFFREGGSAAWVGRVVGPGAVIASRNLVDNAAAVSLIVKAIGPGTYGNLIKVAVVAATAGGVYKIQVYDNANTLLEDSGDLTTQLDAQAWSQNSAYVRITVGASALTPVVAGANVIGALTGGTADQVNAVDANWLAALNLFTKDLGPGNVSAPGQTTTTRYTQLTAHAAANNRTAFLDGPDTPTSATLQTSATNAKSGGNGQYAAMFAPWVITPGVSGVAGTSRTIPPSALAAGRAAATDPIKGPGVPAAGFPFGQSRFATSLSQPGWDDTTRDALNTAGVKIGRAHV